MQIPNQHGNNPEDVKITREEFKQIEKAMKKPQFAELMGDYMKEISDPKNREEYDQYLKQLERDAELPKGMKLIKPDPHFCVKTTIWSKQNRKHEQKFFINICSTSVIDKPSSETITQNGQTGQNWKIPYSIGKIRYDQDKKQNICNTVDVAFHPHTIGFCYKIPSFQNLVCSTALEASHKQLGERNEEISKDFKVLKHTKCKGGEPALLPIKVDKKGKVSNELDERQGGQANAQTKLQKDINQMREESQKQKEEEKQKQQELQLDEEEQPQKESNEIESSAISQPKYRFIYSYPVEYSDFLDSRANQPIKLPNQLGCDLRMQKVSAMKEIQLDLSATNLILDVPEKYFLDIKLPYPIEQQEASAKFDTKTKVLKIRAPISKDYLKTKYQEELEKLKQSDLKEEEQEQPQNEVYQTEEQQIQIKFLPSQIEQPEVENEQKTLVEEIESKENINVEEGELQIEEKKQEEYQQVTYNERKDGKLYFLIIKVKGYKKDSIQIAYDSNNFCLLHKLANDNTLTYQFLHLELQDNQDSKTEIEYVIDFIIVKIESKEEDNQLKVNWKNYAEIPFSQFTDKLEELKAKLQESIERSKESQIPVSKENEKKEEKKIEYIEHHNDEDDQDQNNTQVNQTEIIEEKQEFQPNINQRKTIQFLRFQELMPEIFEID